MKRWVLPVAMAMTIGGVLIGGASMLHERTPDDPGPRTPRPAAGEARYTWSDEPSPVVLRLADREVRLRPWTYCWGGPPREDGTGSSRCVDGMPGKSLPDAGRAEAVDFWFGMPGWEFEATFSQLGVDCPRRYTVDAAGTGDRTFRVRPAGPAGRYQVDLFGRGPAGDVSASFVWRTPTDAPAEPPSSYLALVTDGDGALTSYGVELGVADLGVRPERASARITATAANGRSATVDVAGEHAARKAADCYEFGSLFFTADDAEGQAIAHLGPAPFRYRVVLSLDGSQYVGNAVWPRDQIPDLAPNTILAFDPPLPAAPDPSD